MYLEPVAVLAGWLLAGSPAVARGVQLARGCGTHGCRLCGVPHDVAAQAQTQALTQEHIVTTYAK